VRASKSAEEWLRRMQTVCFSPLAMLNAWADGTKPWSFPEVEEQVRAISALRMQLIPYLYTAFADYAFYGTPPMRAMNLDKGFAPSTSVQEGKLDATKNPYALALRKEVKDQFMVGDHLLIAPLFAGETSRSVVLPAGNWYDFYTGKFAGEGEVITVAPGLDKIPVYVRDGGMIPMYTSAYITADGKYPLEIRHYGKAPASFSLYDDDGKTFNYEKGEFLRIELKVAADNKGKLNGTVQMPKGKKAWSFNSYQFRFMTE
jgi:alpha-D-xyloside xylohydrolase